MSKLNCCEITKKTIDLFQEGGIYDDTCERSGIFDYWNIIGLDKQLCNNCQEL
jgi:hypothetical protein